MRMCCGLPALPEKNLAGAKEACPQETFAVLCILPPFYDHDEHHQFYRKNRIRVTSHSLHT